jgi:hypothetical protein
VCCECGDSIVCCECGEPMHEPCVSTGDAGPESGELGRKGELGAVNWVEKFSAIGIKFSYLGVVGVIMTGPVVCWWMGDSDKIDSSLVEKGEEIESISDEVSDIISEIYDSISCADSNLFDSQFIDEPISAAWKSPELVWKSPEVVWKPPEMARWKSPDVVWKSPDMACWKSPERKSNVTGEDWLWDGFAAPNPTPSASKSPKRSRKAIELDRWKDTDMLVYFMFEFEICKIKKIDKI